MSLNIGDALETGVERSVTSVALVFVVIEFVLQIVGTVSASTVVLQSLTGRTLPSGLTPQDLVTSPTIPLGLAGALVLLVVIALVSILVTIALLRAFVADAERVSADLFTRRGIAAFGHLLAFGIVLSVFAAINVVLVIGTIVYVFVLVCVWFAPLRIAAEDEGFVSAMRESWALTRGNRLRLFALGVIFVVIAGVVVGILDAVLGRAPGGFVVLSAVYAYFTVLNAGLTVAAYEQLLDESGGDGSSATPQPTAAGG